MRLRALVDDAFRVSKEPIKHQTDYSLGSNRSVSEMEDDVLSFVFQVFLDLFRPFLSLSDGATRRRLAPIIPSGIAGSSSNGRSNDTIITADLLRPSSLQGGFMSQI